MAGKKPKRGRPVGATAARTRDVLVQVKVFAEENAAYEDAAQRRGLSKSAWMRFILNEAAKSPP